MQNKKKCQISVGVNETTEVDFLNIACRDSGKDRIRYDVELV